MRKWYIYLSNGFCLVSDQERESGNTITLLTSECAASELPYPFFLIQNKRTVYVRDYHKFISEYRSYE